MYLVAEHLYFRYDSSSEYIIDNVDFCLQSGEKIALTAPSGSGKSTLALLLAAYLKPERGVVKLLDDDKERQFAAASGAKIFTCVAPNKVQLLHQHPEKALNPRWRIKDILAESRAEDIEKYFSRLDIKRAWLERYPCELSGGELSRVATARALLCKPSFLLCDEISAMLDSITQAKIWRSLIACVEEDNIGLLLITHNRHLAATIADKVQDGLFRH